VNESLGLLIDPRSGARWVQDSLRHGSVLSTMVSRRLKDFAVARLLAPEAVSPGNVGVLDNESRGIRTSDVDRLAGQVIARIALAGVRTIVVEDDLARRGDPVLRRDLAYVEDRVVRWVDLIGDPVDGARLLRSGASGYPLNAYACGPSPGDLGLASGRSLELKELESIAASTRAVLASVFDAEAFVMLMLPELGACLK
jgi:hypothetical protein